MTGIHFVENVMLLSVSEDGYKQQHHRGSKQKSESSLKSRSLTTATMTMGKN
jgi:hypothetical protein